MRVDVETDQVHGFAMPRRFRLDTREIEIVEIIDQWFGTDHRYCKLKGSDGALYILRFDENRSEWSLIMFASPEAQAIGAQSGASKHTEQSTID